MIRATTSIRTKLIIFLTVFLVISTGAVVYSIVNIKNQKSDALLINLAGRQRALSQFMSKSVLGLQRSLADTESPDAQKRAEYYRADIIKRRNLFDKTLNAFINGGETMSGSGKTVVLSRATDPALRAHLTESALVWKKFSARLDTILAGTAEPGSADVVAAVSYIEDNNVPLFKYMNKLTGMYQGLSDSKLVNFKRVLYGGVVLNILAFCAIMWLIHRSIISRLAALHRYMAAITGGEGDLTQRVEDCVDDEIGVIGNEFNVLLDNFDEIISRLSESCGTLRDSSSGLKSTFDGLSDGINRQDQRTGQVATAMEEMSATVIEVAKGASSMAEVALKADAAVKNGEDAMQKVIDRMNEIAESTKRSVEGVAALGAESQKIGNIVQVINDIADQTNLLALNAAIEAARAGDQGRGFAVVADEVRKLAERTTKATKEIDSMISGIQNESMKAVESIEQESKAVEQGVVLTKEAGASLSEITGSINTVSDMIQQIATSTEQQSAVASTISADMEAVASISRDSSRAVSDVSSMASGLSALALDLEGTLSRFKVSGTGAAESTRPRSMDDDVTVIETTAAAPGLAAGNA